MNKVTFVLLLLAFFAITQAHPQGVNVVDRNPNEVQVVDNNPGHVNVVDGGNQVNVVDNAGPPNVARGY